MLEVLGYVLFFFAGLFFGLFGSGGSIIILPILIYLFDIPIYQATTYSLLLVFLITFFGTMKHVLSKNLHVEKIWVFILLTLICTGLSRTFLFPNIPSLIPILNISKESFLMILFSIIILFSGLSMFQTDRISIKDSFNIRLILIGIIVGILTGLLGIGGGFIILPVLILFLSMDVKKAATTTLFIIMLNTLLAILLEVTVFNFTFDLGFLFIVLFSSSMGLLTGVYFLNKIDVNLTKKLFSISLLLLSLIIFLLELYKICT